MQRHKKKDGRGDKELEQRPHMMMSLLMRNNQKQCQIYIIWGKIPISNRILDLPFRAWNYRRIFIYSIKYFKVLTTQTNLLRTWLEIVSKSMLKHKMWNQITSLSFCIVWCLVLMEALHPHRSVVTERYPRFKGRELNRWLF